MYLVNARNMHQALPQICHKVQYEGYRCAEEIIRLPMPLSILLQKPAERVLFWEEWIDNTDPFLEFLNGLCSLAKRQSSIAELNATRFDGKVIDSAISALKNGAQFLPVVAGNDPVTGFLTVHFQIGDKGELNMMIANSSIALVPDTIRFSLMQEYVAAGVGCALGSLWWIGMDTYADLKIFRTFLHGMTSYMPSYRNRDRYQDNEVKPSRLVSIPFNRFRRELDTFLVSRTEGTYTDPTLTNGAVPILRAYLACQKEEYSTARHCLDECTLHDWRAACFKWISRKEME